MTPNFVMVKYGRSATQMAVYVGDVKRARGPRAWKMLKWSASAHKWTSKPVATERSDIVMSGKLPPAREVERAREALATHPEWIAWAKRHEERQAQLRATAPVLSEETKAGLRAFNSALTSAFMGSAPRGGQ